MIDTQTNILITGVIAKHALEQFKSNKKVKIIYEPDCSREKLEQLIVNAKVLITRSETKIDSTLIELGKDLKVIARAAVGVANIDIDYASEKGILVLNTPGKNTNSAAELSFGLILSVLRKITKANEKVKNGGWERHTFSGNELKGKTLGIVGLGHVGHRVAKFAHGFDMKVMAYDPYISPDKFVRYGVVPVPSLEELAEKVDILSVHVPLNRETRGMVDKAILARMTPGTYIINAARGGVIDEEGLLESLNSGHIAGAGIDTWVNEPDIFKQLAVHKNVVTTPHIGASTSEAQFAIGQSIYEQVIKAIEGTVVDHPVNLPQIGMIDDGLVKPYAILAEKLGSLAGQMIRSNPKKIEVLYRGNLAGGDHSLINLGWMKGYVSCAVDSYVSYVNAHSHFENMGLSLTESQDPSFDSYRSAIKFVLHYDKGETLSVGGIVFDQSYMRISYIDGHYFEIEPTGNFVLIRNSDRPGVIGDVGRLIADEGINIDSFDLSRKKLGGEAMALVKVDSEVEVRTIEKLTSLSNVSSVVNISL